MWKMCIRDRLTSFYQLDDESRQEVVETIRLKLQYHRDPERAEQIKQDVYKRQVLLNSIPNPANNNLHAKYSLIRSFHHKCVFP